MKITNFKKKLMIYTFFTAIICFMLSSASYSKDITRLSGIPGIHHLKQFYHVKNFKIGGTYNFKNISENEFGGKGGVILESLGYGPLRLAYIAVGQPIYNKNKKIINAIVINPYYSGDSTFMYFFWYEKQAGNNFAKGTVVGPGQLIDTNKYYVVFLDSPGLWGTSKPSDGLGMKSPKYSYLDYVQANYRLLKDKLGIANIKLSTGVSMGGMQSYVWAVMHPELIEAIMPIGGTPCLPMDVSINDRRHKK